MKISKRKPQPPAEARPPYAGRVGENGARAERPADGKRSPPTDNRRGAKGPSSAARG